MEKKIIDARADSEGDITSVRFRGNAGFTPIRQAIRMADRGEVESAHAVLPRCENSYLRSNPDSKKGNDLDEMAGDHR